jgi:hypothetical protein
MKVLSGEPVVIDQGLIDGINKQKDMLERLGNGLSPPPLENPTLEPIHKVVESEESVVIPSLAPASLLRGAECGSLNTAVRPTAMACATRMI